MKQKTKDRLLIAFVASSLMFFLIGVQKGCSERKRNGDVILKIERRVDTVYEVKHEYVPTYLYKTNTKWDTVVLTKTDTVEFIRDYVATREYMDTIAVDSCFMVVLKDSVTENKIQKRTWEAECYKQETIITKEIEVEKKGAWLKYVYGGAVGLLGGMVVGLGLK